MELDGGGDHHAFTLDPGGAGNLDGFTGLTLAAWIRPDTVEPGAWGARMIISKYAVYGTSTSYFLLLRGDELEVYVGQVGGEALLTSSGVDLTVGEWTHVAGTWNGMTLRLFVNAVEVASLPLSGVTHMSDSAVRVALGSDETGARFNLDGGLDEAFIFSRALSGPEISALASMTPTVTAGQALAAEGAGQLVLEVSLSQGSSETVTVSYATVDGTAAAPGDYLAQTGVLAFDPGDTSEAVTVALIDDTVAEADESFEVVLTDPVNAALIGTPSGSVTIVDDDDTSAPVVTVPGNMTVEAMGPSGAAVTFTASATDVLHPDPPVTCVPASGSVFRLGTTTVRCSATDAAGNTGRAKFKVTVAYFCGGRKATIVGTGASETLTGTDGNDVIVALGGDDIVQGGLGRDRICGGPGSDTLNGGGGIDLIYGQSGQDRLVGGPGADQLDGGTGDDILGDGGGNDTVLGGEGNDWFNAGLGVNALTGGEGDDDFWMRWGANTVDGGEGADWLIYTTATEGRTIVLADFPGVEHVRGSNFADQITGTAGANQLIGEGGDDTISGGGGDDDLVGQSGNDTLRGEAGADQLIGGPGSDSLDGGIGSDILDGGDDNDTLKGGDGSDTLWGGPGADTISGGLGNDVITGDDGNDTLDGNEGTDWVSGNAGTDTCYGETLDSCELPPPFTFGNGTWRVGIDIPAGRYRMRSDGSSCYWARLSGFGGTLGDILANDFGYDTQIVDIKATDKGFESSSCNLWSSNLTPRRSNPSADWRSDGDLLVGEEITPGTWRNSGMGDYCYWERLRGFRGILADIIANDFTDTTSIVHIGLNDTGFYADPDCGTWTKIG